MKKAIEAYYPFFPLLLLCIFYGCKAIGFPIHDFSNYYFGGKFLAEGSFSFKTYFPYEFNKAISGLGYSGIFASYAPNTPFLAVFFSPFSVFSATTAKLIFNSISIGLFVFGIFRLFSFYKLNPKFALLIPIVFLVPIKNNLLFGQVYFLLFFLLSEGWIACEEKRFKSMAFFWGLAILLKVFPVLLLVFLLFKKNWKALFYLSLSCLLIFGISLFFTGIEIWFFYLKAVLPKASNGEIATAFVDNYQSVLMFLKRLFIYENTENPHPFFHDGSWYQAILFAFKIGMVTLGYFVSRKNSKSLAIFSYWMLVMLLLSPYGSTYTLILLVFPLLALLKSEVSNSTKGILCLILLLICNLPLSYFIENQFPFSYLRLFFLIAFFVLFVVLLHRKSTVLKAILVGCIIFFIGTFFKQEKQGRSKLLLDSNSPILIYDYQVKNNQLTYFYWNEKGENKASIPFKAMTVSELDIKENQVVSGTAVTSDASHKSKPLFIDNKTVLFLSDYDRGIGFYTIRKIEIKP